MAERRMISGALIASDRFSDMPFASQVVYIRLSTEADDDGFITSPKGIARSIGATLDDLERLYSEGFLIRFDSGVTVITHWLVNNRIRKDRYRETLFKKEKQMLDVDSGGAYVLVENRNVRENTVTAGEYRQIINAESEVRTDRADDGEDGGEAKTTPKPVGYKTVTERMESGSDSATQYSVGKDKKEKDSISSEREGESDSCDGDGKGVAVQKETRAHAPSEKKKPYGRYENVFLTDGEFDILVRKYPDDYNDKINRLSQYMCINGKTYCNHLAVMEKWAEEDKEKNTPKSHDSHGSRDNTRDTSSFETEDFFAMALKKSYGEELVGAEYTTGENRSGA